MRPTRSRRLPPLNAPILLRAQAVLTTTQHAWQVHGDADGIASHTSGRAAARLRGLDIAAARLVSRVYRYASAPLRAEMLACLLRPLSTLSLVAVASGAFASLLQRDGGMPGTIPLEMAARYSSDQVLELALYVHDVNPVVLAQLTALLSDGAIGAAAFSASALVLLVRKLRFAPPSPAYAWKEPR